MSSFKDKKPFEAIVSQSSDPNDLNHLKQIIFGLSQSELERLQIWLREPGFFAIEIRDHLPSALKKLVDEDKLNINDITRITEDAIENSISKNHIRLADILYPIMMPAIRKAVAESINKMMEGINSTLEHSVSVKRLGWRIQSMRGSKSYAEIVLSNSFIYQVKQVFLIHRTTGILLNQVKGGESYVQDADMVSAMLTAIKDFVNDSLKGEGETTLDTIRVSGYDILIEQGPYSLIAGIIEGKPPLAVRDTFHTSLESIHLNFAYYLQKFDGDTAHFKNTTNDLNKCLLKESKGKKKKPPYFLLIILFALLIYLGYLGFNRLEKELRWSSYISSIESNTGLIILEKGYSKGKYYIVGLRDPFAIDPNLGLEDFNFEDSDVVSQWNPFYSLESEFILERAKYHLRPNENTTLKLENGTLFIEGEFDKKWKEETLIIYRAIYGIQRIEFPITDEYIEERITYNTKEIEHHFFRFDYNIVEISETQKEVFDALISEIQEIIYLIDQSGDSFTVEVLSHTSYKGNAKANFEVALGRAKEFIQLMINDDIKASTLTPKVVYIEDNSNNFEVRTVSFKVIVN